ncbi:hypothetical protein Lal_00035437 [Lupinus albus]|nr:hypothetical protein Lal_00035437 [Lupinus albus]
MISGTKYPTANIYFPKICQIKLAISQWMNSSNEFIKRMAENMMTKFENYWSAIHDIMGLLQSWILDIKWHYLNSILISCMTMMHVRKLAKSECYDLVSDYQQTKISRNLYSSFTEEYATVLNEMKFDDEAEVMNNNLSYSHIISPTLRTKDASPSA